MEREKKFKFILLDLGHPMTTNTTRNLINSIENILSLSLFFRRRTTEIYFGISILDSNFTIFHSESNLRKNFDLVTKNLNSVWKKGKDRVTVQEYKTLLSSSIEKILLQSQQECKKIHNFGTLLIELAVFTGKTASVVAEISSDVINKLEKTLSQVEVVKAFKIIQIITEQQENIQGTSTKNTAIEWIICRENSNGLDCFLKEWLLNSQQQLRILLSSDLDLEIKCDVDDFVISLEFLNNGRTNELNSFWVSGTKEIQQLEIINRLPVNGLCPTLVFGVPRCLYATTYRSSNWSKLEINRKIFTELCRELNQTNQGLLAKSIFRIESSKIINFHFLTSDGKVLLMNDVAPHELFFPKKSENTNTKFVEDETAVSVVKSCLHKIKFLREYIPDNFSSGLYDYLKDSLVTAVQKKSLFGRFNPNFKLFGKESRKTKSSGPEKGSEKFRKKRPKLNTEELKNIHPALLDPNIVDKYRKIPSNAFSPPELTQDCKDNLTCNF